MKFSIKKKITLNATLDSSETIMFNQGGMHKINLPLDDLIKGKEIEHESWEDSGPELEITFQLERSQQNRFDFINSEAKKHKERCAQDETQQTRNP